MADLARFSVRVVRDVPLALRLYPSEVLAQAGNLVRGSALIILFLIAVLALQSGVGGHFIFANPGINSYAGAIYSVALMRGLVEVIFGWIVAAKIGCGIVAEMGSMRINEEVDALDVMGLRSRAYLAGTRVAAAMLVLPFLFVTALLVQFQAGYLMSVHGMNTVSEGAFYEYLYLFQNLRDFITALIWGSVTGVMCVIVATFYGYNAKGGPVGVGESTARSMTVNLVLISALAVVFAQLFYGGTPNAPIGN
ncbi:ABC transporter permease [Pseudonocardia sp. Ae707_Ps1]|uniref:ABC transporter permease n=2 Tax=unclassified Pseudonocardia TaxID=2619320 RepID=UPI00111516FF|nr:ABC transporter permease [Pseudonocardia sp. Ae707_Ps1]